MGNSLRCCLACVLPCGALDVVRIVHLCGHVEEYGRPVTAGEVLAANPGHVITEPCSQAVVGRKILVVPPEAELRRGSIYFLIPHSSLPLAAKRKEKNGRSSANMLTKRQSQRRVVAIDHGDDEDRHGDGGGEVGGVEKKAGQHRRRHSGRVPVWRPHLESIVED